MNASKLMVLTKKINDEDIECEVKNLFDEINVRIDPESDIHACHRIGSRGTIIVKLSNRKSVTEIMKSKTKLRFRDREKIFINESLCPTIRKITGCCNVLKKKGAAKD